MSVDLVLLSALVIAFGIAMYVLLDGFDLGVGILFLVARNEHDRQLLMVSIAPVWDGNETWLVLGGAMLLAAFPGAYSLLLPAWYVPLLVFLFALVFRGVAFEFRPQARQKRPWGWSFGFGSLVAALAQGALLGSFVQGFEVRDGRYIGGLWGWLTPFSVMTAFGVAAGYALLGAAWTIYKTEGSLQAWCYPLARRLTLVVIGFIVVVSLWTPWTEPAIAARWFGWPNLLYLSPVPLLTAAIAWRLWLALARGRELAPFVYAAALFLLGFLGLAISTWPYAVPRALTVWDAASSPATQAFMLIGVAILLPLVLGYTIHTYRVFRHKANVASGYH
ncbi:MAG: cytochrome d ubiquinol oxidase subunit II [Sulfurifustaceae bacterium]